jgi:nucleoside-diphosphate-sugar epimerase
VIDETITVFGSSGFIGSHFWGHNPDRVILQPRNDAVPATNNILWLISTLSNYNVFDDLLIDIDTNLILLMGMLKQAKKKFGDDFCVNYVSTWFVYGLGKDNPVKETELCNPKGFYAITKHTAEQLLESYCSTFGIKYRILRLANVLGRGDRDTSYQKKAAQFMISELSAGNKVKLYKDVSVRDFIDVRDCVRAIELVIDVGDWNTIYNVGNGEGIAVNSLIYQAQEIAGKGSIYEVEVPIFHKKVQTREFWMDTTKLKSLGYRQKYTLDDTLKWMING